MRVIRVALSALPSVPPSANAPKSFSKVRTCCAARTSVGASNAACPPLSTTANIARSATTVLPEPTSPCKSRCIGWGCAKSSSISFITASWPPVSPNGSAASKASRIPPLIALREIVLSFFNSLRRITNMSCNKKASSNVNRARAASACSKSAGACNCTKACCKVG